MVEMTFMLYRCLLPVPAWVKFYGRHSDYFPVIYLVLKVMYRYKRDPESDRPAAAVATPENSSIN